MGGEALRVLLEHPEFSVSWVSSRSHDRISAVHRNLLGVDVPVIRPEDISPCDAYVVSLPSGRSMEVVPQLLESGGVVVDLGSDFRLEDRSTWERVYGLHHSAWDLTQRAVYGIPEIHRDEIRTARLIANPGCFSSAVIFALAPLASQGLLEDTNVNVTGISGTAGIGAEVSVVSHHPEIGNNVVPYNAVDHRHSYEMEQELSAMTAQPVTVHFTPTYVPITRGIVAICHIHPIDITALSKIKELFTDYYHDEPFIRVIDEEPETGVSWQWRPYPSVSSVSGTNFCHLGMDYDERRRRLVVFSVLDNMGKGGAHAGVQNLNLTLGLDEETGLTRHGLHPY
jgi:N-acetyl-gamma-glutamyl-phosphate reductase common form